MTEFASALRVQSRRRIVRQVENAVSFVVLATVMLLFLVLGH